MINLLVLNGPNLNLLGEREPDIYGTETLKEIEAWLRALPESRTVVLTFFQSNHEGALIDKIHEVRNTMDGIIFNPGAYAHTSYALHDALAAVNIPTVEVHLSDITKRESFRMKSVIASVCIDQISGQGKDGYRLAVKRLLAEIQSD